MIAYGSRASQFKIPPVESTFDWSEFTEDKAVDYMRALTASSARDGFKPAVICMLLYRQTSILSLIFAVKTWSFWRVRAKNPLVFVAFRAIN
jgi:hypothetical protein